MFENYPAINVNKRTNFSKTIIEEKTMSTYIDTASTDFKVCQDSKNDFFISNPAITNTIIDLYAIKDSKITNLFLPENINEMNIRLLPTTVCNINNVKVIYIPSTVTEITRSIQIPIYATKSLEYLYLPSSIKNINNFSLQNSTIKNIYIDANINATTENMFKNCKNLENVVLNNNIKIIAESTFEECAINKIILPNLLEEINEKAFKKTKLKEIEIPQSVKIIKSKAFSATPLKKVVFKNMDTIIEPQAFSTTSKFEVEVYGTKTKYKKWLEENEEKLKKAKSIKLIEV